MNKPFCCLNSHPQASLYTVSSSRTQNQLKRRGSIGSRKGERERAKLCVFRFRLEWSLFWLSFDIPKKERKNYANSMPHRSWWRNNYFLPTKSINDSMCACTVLHSQPNPFLYCSSVLLFVECTSTHTHTHSRRVVYTVRASNVP